LEQFEARQGGFAGRDYEDEAAAWQGHGVFGSADLVSTFTNHGLIDEYRIFVNPIVLGDGKPLFKDVSERQKLKLVNTKPFTTGVVGLFYQKSKE